MRLTTLLSLWRARSPLAVLILLSCLSGCKVGPEYVPPQATVNAQWIQQHHPRLSGEPAHLSYWWSHFQDPVLDNLVSQALAQNLTLQEAGQRIVEADSRLAFAAGNLYPQTQAANGSFSKSRTSSDTANFFEIPGIFAQNRRPENWNFNASTAWELDFWGRYRRAVESADARLMASLADYYDVQVILLAQVASTYVELRTFERRIALASENVGIQKRTLRMITEKKLAGLASDIDVAQAESNLGRTKSSLPQLEIQRRQACHRLAVLLGQPPSDLEAYLGFTGIIPHAPHNLAFDIPANLMRRRPDVGRAERELAAQSAKIGIAESELYPHISLIGSVGYSAENFSDLGRSSSAVALISPSFNWNLLNYGRIRSNINAERAIFEQRALAYQQAVLVAQREAEDAQVAYLLGFDQADSLIYAVRGAERAVAKLDQAFRAGTIDYGRVYVLQSELVDQQDQLARVEAEIALNLIRLFKAVGGGWEAMPNGPCGPQQEAVAFH